MAPKILNISAPDLRLQDELARSLDVSKITAQLLINRGMRTQADAAAFLSAGLESLIDPFSFSEMKLAVNLVFSAVRDKKKILIFSDYDVDGVTSLAVLKDTLTALGARTCHYIPHRVKEGYGLNRSAVRVAKENDAGLVITADCGTNSVDIIRELRASGVQVLVTDHHETSVSCEGHPASALLNPKVPGSAYAFRELAGVGVAYKLCQAVAGKQLLNELDLVALGTVSDSVPLTGENRVLAREGMARLPGSSRPGIRMLMETSGIKDKPVTTQTISFILGPRINASGRMDSAETAVSLLLTRDEGEALALAKELENYNRQRQKVEGRIRDEAEALIEQEVNFASQKVIVVAKEGWHAGCLGIVASKLADKFYRPAILISLDGERSCRGSGRSIRNFHLFNGLKHCGRLLDNYGGHEHAVGMAIDQANIAEFREELNLFALEKLQLNDLIPALDIDMKVTLAELDYSLIRELARLEPFGEGNPEPVFYTTGLALKGQARALARSARKFWVTDCSCTFPAIGFGMAGLKSSLESSREFDLVYTPRIDSWQGVDSIILEIKEIFLR